MTNNDIYKFVNSKDIRQHLININYVFSTVEAAWLVYQCHRLTLQDRLSAWQDIIDTMPDQSVTSAHFEKPYESIHKVLDDYISMKKETLKRLLEQSSATIFQCKLVYSNLPCSFDESIAWSTYDKCLRQLMLDFKNDEDDDIQYGVIRRCEIDGWLPVTAYYDRNGNILDVEIHSDYGVFDWRITDFFDCLWFHFPVPYKPGDILYDPFHPRRCDCPGPVVMDGITPLQYEKDKYSHTDSSDMNVWGYFQDEETGTIYHEVTWNYMDYEYFPENELKGKKRILKALSNYMKEEISLDLFIRAYHLIILEENRNDLMPRGWFTDKGLELAGLKTDPTNTAK